MVVEGKDTVPSGGHPPLRRRLSPTAETERRDFEARVARAARRFGPKALCDLLLSRGYTREQILFQSNPEGGSSSFVEAVEFRARPVPIVLITVNVGLLGDNS